MVVPISQENIEKFKTFDPDTQSRIIAALDRFAGGRGIAHLYNRPEATKFVEDVIYQTGLDRSVERGRLMDIRMAAQQAGFSSPEEAAGVTKQLGVSFPSLKLSPQSQLQSQQQLEAARQAGEPAASPYGLPSLSPTTTSLTPKLSGTETFLSATDIGGKIQSINMLEATDYGKQLYNEGVGMEVVAAIPVGIPKEPSIISKSLSKLTSILPTSVAAEELKREQELKASTGKWEIAPTIGKINYNTDLGYDKGVEGAAFEKGTAIVTKVTPYTSEELYSGWSLPFAGTKELQRREESKLNLRSEILINNKIKELTPSFQNELNIYSRDLSNKVSSGKLTSSEAQSLLDKKVSEVNKNFQSQIREEISPEINKWTKETNIYLREASANQLFAQQIALMPITAGQAYIIGLPFGAGFAALGGIGKGTALASKTVGAAFGGMLIGSTAANVVNIYETSQSKLERSKLLGAMAVGTGTTLIAGGIGAYQGAKWYTNIQIEDAIANSHPVQQGKSLSITKSNLKNKVFISEDGRKEIINLLNKGKTVELVKYEWRATSTANQKWLPKIEGWVLNVKDRSGMIVDKYTIGNVASTFQGKTLSTDIIAKATGKIEGDMLTYYSRALYIKDKAGWHVKFPTGELYKEGDVTKYAETLEKIDLKMIKQQGKWEFLNADTEARLIKEIINPKAKDITQFYHAIEKPAGKIKFVGGDLSSPTENALNELLSEWGRYKTIGKGESWYKGVITDVGAKKVEVTNLEKFYESGTKEYLLETTRSDFGQGLSLFNSIKEDTKIFSKMMKPLETSATKVTPYIPSRATFTYDIIPSETTTQAIAPISEYYGQGLYEQYTPQAISKIVSNQFLLGKALEPSLLTTQFAATTALQITPIIGLLTSQKLETIPATKLEQQKLQTQLLSSELSNIQTTTKMQQTVASIFNLQITQLPVQTTKITQVQSFITPQESMMPRVPIVPLFDLGWPFPKKKIRIDESIYRKKKKKGEKQYKYQPSVAAFSLGITATPKEISKMKRFTGLEIRPQYSDRYYKESQPYNDYYDNLFNIKRPKSNKKTKSNKKYKYINILKPINININNKYSKDLTKSIKLL